MVGLDPITSMSLLVLASSSPAHNAGACQMEHPTKINVIPTTKEIKYDYRKSLQDIQAVQTDTVNPYGFHAFTVTQGFMQGQVKFTPTVTLDFSTVPKSQSACLWYKEINLEIEIDPTIVIGREVYMDPCMRKAVIEHEHKHVKADREVVNKYARRMGNKLYDALSKKGFIIGPIHPEEAQATADMMHEAVHAILKVEYMNMEQERALSQQSIDNRAEYDRVAAQCPKFDPTKHIERQ